MAEGASVQVTVLVDGVPVAGSPFTFTRDCEHAAGVVSHACAASGLDVTVTNSGDDSGVFSIDGTSESLAPGEAFTRNVAVAEGASVQVTVLVDGVPVAGSPFTFTRDCEAPGAQATNNCTARGADLVLTNSGPSPAALVIDENGVPVDVVDLPGGSTVVRSFGLSEDEVAVFRVTGAGFDSGDLVVVHDCAQVGSTPTVQVVSPPSRLAFTGAANGPLALTGGLFLGIGTLAALGGRRRRKVSGHL